MDIVNVYERLRHSDIKNPEIYEDCIVDLIINISYFTYKDMTLFHDDIFRKGVGYVKYKDADILVVVNNTLLEHNVEIGEDDLILLTNWLLAELSIIRNGYPPDHFFQYNKIGKHMINITILGSVYEIMWRDMISWMRK